MAPTRCPACDDAELDGFFELRGVPVHCNVFAASAAAARQAQRGDIRLGFCSRCGMIYNQSFDPSLLRYTASYETSLHFSPHFRTWAEGLARRLCERHGLDDADVIEIGCGKGDFLRLLAAGGRNRCVGFDESYGDEQGSDLGDGTRIVKAFWSPAAWPELRADLIVCRHVLEHLAAPRPFATDLAAGLKPGGAVYLEVPDTLFTLREGGIWDLIYEHCSYFTAPSLAWLCRAAGLLPTAIDGAFGGQFLCLEASPGAAGEPASAALPVAEIAALVAAFADRFRRKVATWNEELGRRLDAGRRVAVWGAGSKGVTFLNTVARGAEVHAVVDINPRKRGRFVAGTGQRILAAAELAATRIDTVLVMNPNYRHEIAGQIANMRLEADVLAV